MRRKLIIVPFVVSLFQFAIAEEPSVFIGAIPVQYVSPGEKLTIDMHRFYQPASESQLQIGKVEGVTADFDPSTFELHATAEKSGIIDIPIAVVANERTKLDVAQAPVAPPSRQSAITVLTLAVAPSLVIISRSNPHRQLRELPLQVLSTVGARTKLPSPARTKPAPILWICHSIPVGILTSSS